MNNRSRANKQQKQTEAPFDRTSYASGLWLNTLAVRLYLVADDNAHGAVQQLKTRLICQRSREVHYRFCSVSVDTRNQLR